MVIPLVAQNIGEWGHATIQDLTSSEHFLAREVLSRAVYSVSIATMGVATAAFHIATAASKVPKIVAVMVFEHSLFSPWKQVWEENLKLGLSILPLSLVVTSVSLLWYSSSELPKTMEETVKLFNTAAEALAPTPNDGSYKSLLRKVLMWPSANQKAISMVAILIQLVNIVVMEKWIRVHRRQGQEYRESQDREKHDYRNGNFEQDRQHEQQQRFIASRPLAFTVSDFTGLEECLASLPAEKVSQLDKAAINAGWFTSSIPGASFLAGCKALIGESEAMSRDHAIELASKIYSDPSDCTSVGREFRKMSLIVHPEKNRECKNIGTLQRCMATVRELVCPKNSWEPFL